MGGGTKPASEMGGQFGLEGVKKGTLLYSGEEGERERGRGCEMECKQKCISL